MSSWGDISSVTGWAPLTASTSLSPAKYVPIPEIAPIPMAPTVVNRPPAALPKNTYPIAKPSSPSRTTTNSAIRNEFRRLAEICW